MRAPACSVGILVFVRVGGASFAGLRPSCPRDLGYAGVPVAEHALWAEVGGGHYLRGLLGVHWFLGR